MFIGTKDISVCRLFFAIFFSTLTLLPLAPQIQVAYASGNSAYESGYDHGCDDANISDSDDRYINQPERGPRFHTPQFMDGYRAGFSSCSGSIQDDNRGAPSTPNRATGINWEQLCLDYGDVIDIAPQDCSNYANGNQLTQLGRTYLVEKLKDAAGTIGTLASILGPFL
jgi:hypothetical protein